MRGTSLEGREVNADTAEGIAEAAAFGVLAAPTVVFFDQEGEELARAFSVDELEEIWTGMKEGSQPAAQDTLPPGGEFSPAEKGL
jgi:hypothetical protein